MANFGSSWLPLFEWWSLFAKEWPSRVAYGCLIWAMGLFEPISFCGRCAGPLQCGWRGVALLWSSDRKPGSLRLLAALPKVAVITGCGGAVTPEGPLNPIQATQVGLVWRMARRIMAAASGVVETNFYVDPWLEASSTSAGGTSPPEPTSRPASGSVRERVLKMNSFIDQQDESVLL